MRKIEKEEVNRVDFRQTSGERCYSREFVSKYFSFSRRNKLRMMIQTRRFTIFALLTWLLGKWIFIFHLRADVLFIH